MTSKPIQHIIPLLSLPLTNLLPLSFNLNAQKEMKMSQNGSQHKLSRRRFLQQSAAMGTAFGLVTLAGCVPAVQPSGGEGEAAAETAQVLYWKSPHSENEVELWTPLLEKFMDENPGITVEHQVIPWASVDEQYTAAFAAGSPPDVFYLPDEWYPKYVNQGQIADINDHIKDWEEQYTSAGWAGVTYKVGTWGAPFLGVAEMWLCNMNLFNEKGLSVPTNWEEFRAAAAELTDVEAGIYGAAPFVLGWGSWIIGIPLLATGGTKLLSDDLMSVACNTEGGIAAFKMLYEDIGWTDKSTTPLGFSDDQNNALAVEGKVGMKWSETWRVKAAWRPEAPDIELAAIPMLHRRRQECKLGQHWLHVHRRGVEG
ncbi:extracellular solute-binding protein [Chloroflexi bacterium TSY]|nr:extracellular solute-binding protein [Chloroflexi bacterium TSY]